MDEMNAHNLNGLAQCAVFQKLRSERDVLSTLPVVKQNARPADDPARGE
jgi:hypothetical protein